MGEVSNSEREIKLAASPAMLAVLRSHPSLAGEDLLEILDTTYFDTPDHRLDAGGASLRIRRSLGGAIQTLKLASASPSGITRREWEVPANGDAPDPQAFPHAARQVLARLTGAATLCELGQSHVARTVRRLAHLDAVIEAAFDCGQIIANGRTEAISELELELVDGSFADLCDLALKLPLGPELGWSLPSKAERCHILASGAPGPIRRAVNSPLIPGMTTAEAFQAIAWNCLEHLLATYTQILSRGEAGAIHQSRVAIRRLRAACSLFGEIANDPKSRLLRRELHAVASGLGPTRELDVLLALVEPGDGEGLREQLSRSRDLAMREVDVLLRSAPFQHLLLEFAQWIEGGEWLATCAATGGNAPIGKVAAGLLDGRFRPIRRARRPLATMTDTDRHRLRIAAKKLRYAAGFLAPLWKHSARRKAKFAAQLSRLQDRLGELNDRATAAASRRALFAGLDPITVARHTAELDAIFERRGLTERRLLKAAQKELDALREGPCWWQD